MQEIPGLACLGCHRSLQADGDLALQCPRCRTRYPVIDGIPSFVRTGETQVSPPACALSLVIPTLNEAANLERLLPAIDRVVRSLGVSAEVLIVDGGSSDGTGEVARRHRARVIIQRSPGYGGAIREGLEHAAGQYILTLDADGSHDPSFLNDLWAARSTAEVIIASRYVPGGGALMPFYRFVLSRVLNTVFRHGLSLPVRDLSSGYRLYARGAVQQLEVNATDFNIQQETVIQVLSAGYRVREVPFQYRTRMSGKSHVRLLKFGLSYLRTFKAMWKLRNSIASADYDARAFDSLVPLQRYWQRRRHQIIARQSAGFATVLDVGCGSSRTLASKPWLVGLDIQMRKLRYARRYGNPLVHGSIFELPFADGSFDCVICSEVIEHIPADERAFHELVRVLKPGGRLILGTPDYDRWSWRALEWAYARLSPGGYADEHITHYGRANLTAYLRARGLEAERVDYVGASEMILSLRKPAPTAAIAPTPPVESALHARRAA